MGRGRVRGGWVWRWRGGVAREVRGREGRGRVIPVSKVVSPPYTNSVCVEMEASCKQS